MKAEYVSTDDCAAAISKATGQTLKYVEVPRDAAAAAGYPGAADIANMCALTALVAFLSSWSRLWLSGVLPPLLSQHIPSASYVQTFGLQVQRLL